MGRISRNHNTLAVRVAAALTLAVALVALPAGIASAASAFDEGRTAHLRGRHADAVSWFRAHLAARPHDAGAWIWLGASHYQLRQGEPAAAAFERAARLSPSGEVALWLGAAYVSMGREEDARRAFAHAARAGRPQTALRARQWLRSMQGRTVAVIGRNARPEDYAYIVRWYNRSLTSTQVDAIVRSVLYYSDHYQVDPRLVMSLIAIESGFVVTARSPAGAYGLGQLMPATWQMMRVHPGDPVANIYATVRVLRGQLDRFGHNPSLALAAYNAGRGAVERYHGVPPYRETQWYVYNVMSLFLHLAGES